MSIDTELEAARNEWGRMSNDLLARKNLAMEASLVRVIELIKLKISRGELDRADDERVRTVATNAVVVGGFMRFAKKVQDTLRQTGIDYAITKVLAGDILVSGTAERPKYYHADFEGEHSIGALFDRIIAGEEPDFFPETLINASGVKHLLIGHPLLDAEPKAAVINAIRPDPDTGLGAGEFAPA